MAADPGDLAERVGVVCVCVRSDADLLEVCTGPAGLVAHLHPGSVLVVHSTVAPGTVRAVAAGAESSSVVVLDAPVSGGGAAAAEGRLLTIVGGDQEVLDHCRPVLASHSDRIIRVGDVGAGQVAKLLNNGLFAANVALAHTALAAGVQLGVEADQLGAVLAAGSGQSYAADRVVAAHGADLRPAIRDLMQKDVGLLQVLMEGLAVGKELGTAAAWVL
jgi:3-hydroxyisobutyrate dehydrogenase-like beta-hydroxyacid dehydrogenase